MLQGPPAQVLLRQVLAWLRVSTQLALAPQLVLAPQPERQPVLRQVPPPVALMRFRHGISRRRLFP